ncbi:Ribosomal RNA-processing protein 14 [Verticillium dahliae VDG1]|nr:Ribosomal RNA-processing protein 14 [Verticillium dahliae VDG1]
MAPLILHNVPDDELYVGDDGVKRPYAMVFPQQDGLPGVRSRRGVAETGSFGRSTRRSRSRTGTPARRENPTLAAADKLFGSWVSNNAATITSANTSAPAGNLLGNAPQRKTSSQHLQQDDAAAASGASSTQRLLKSEPTEVILRGYRSSAQQYAAINHYEHLAGLICEDYPREPPPEQRRYKGDLRDPAFTRRRALTPEERAKVNRADGGEHWVKVTFESLEAADAALFSSPQTIQGCQDALFCTHIPTARKVTLKPVEQAILPSQSFTAKLLAAVPFLMWFIGGFGAMIGNEVPRRDDGDFDYDRASLYWKFIWWLDATFGLFGGEIVSAVDKDD